jgi:hypothetical protein
MKSKTFFLGSYSQIEECLEYIRDIGIDAKIRVDIEESDMLESPVRTLKQNNAFHKWLRLLAAALNDAGYSVQDGTLIRVPVLYTMENLKENVVYPMMQHLFPDVKTSKRLKIDQINFLYEHIDQVVSERTGVHVEFPHQEE